MESDEKSVGWPGLVSELAKGFLILRDVFGYALPGAVFLGVGLVCKRFSLGDVQYYVFRPYHPPVWLASLAGLGVCYVVGHLMAVIAYMPYDFAAEDAAKVSKMILIRAQRPELLIELDRQDTMRIMRGSTGVALLLGAILFSFLPDTPRLGWMLAVAGALLWAIFFLAKRHLKVLTEATEKAADSPELKTSLAEGAILEVKQALLNATTAIAEALKKL